MRKRVIVAAMALMLTLNLMPVSQTVVYAEETTAEEITTDREAPKESTPDEETAGEITKDQEAPKESLPDENAAGETTRDEEILGESTPGKTTTEKLPVDDTVDKTGQAPMRKAAARKGDNVEETSLKLLYGDENLADEDALVLLVLGDGFTAEEQDTFWRYAQTSAEYLMTVSPWDEFTGNVKIYGIGTVSNESGVKGDKAPNYTAAQADTRDTYFGAYYWSGGTQRSLGIGNMQAVKDLKDKYGITTDSDIIFVNSETEGGTTWTNQRTILLSIDKDVNDCIVHELGHCVAWLADEYWAYGYEAPNMTKESEPEKVKWARFVGLNGVGVYSYGGAGADWYRPSQGCKMQLLKNDFCEVCKEALRDSIAEWSNVNNIAFQTYADQFYEREAGKDMSEYFILRKGENRATGDTLGDALHLTYKDSEGNVLDGSPDKAGDYTVTAEFEGNEQFDPCTLTGSYTIQLPNLITIDVTSKDYDGEPIDMSYTVEGYKGDEYDAEITYEGTFPYSKDANAVYRSSEAPRVQGNYTVTVEIYDKETGKIISRKSKDFEIKFGTTTVMENSDPSWPGASSADSNFTYYIFGDGYTAEEQDKFLADAETFVQNFLLQEPYREMSSYFNFYAVPIVSETSGISDPNGDTYFGLSLDENGKIVASKNASLMAQNIAYDKLDPYYRTVFVLANDENVTSGTVYTGYHGAIFTTADEVGAAYAAREATNIFVENDPGYETTSEEELEEQKGLFLEWLAWGYYTMILSDTYDAEFVENGEHVDITDYLHTYNTSIEIPNDKIQYGITYYADDNGKVGDELEGVPSEPGTYHAFVTLVPNYEDYGVWDENSGDFYYITKAWTTFVIEHAEAARVEAVQPTHEKGGNVAYWYCEYCGKYYADMDGVMDESTAYDDNSAFLLPALANDDKPGTDDNSNGGTTDKPNAGTDSKPNAGTDNKPGGGTNQGTGTSAQTNHSSGTDKTTQTAVKTGDTSNAPVWFLMLAGSGIIAVVAAYRRKVSAR